MECKREVNHLQAVRTLKDAGLTDLRDVATVTDTGSTFNGETAVIDYVMANGALQTARAFTVLREEHNGLYPSDHFAVFGVCTLKG